MRLPLLLAAAAALSLLAASPLAQARDCAYWSGNGPSVYSMQQGLTPTYAGAVDQAGMGGAAHGVPHRHADELGLDQGGATSSAHILQYVDAIQQLKVQQSDYVPLWITEFGWQAPKNRERFERMVQWQARREPNASRADLEKKTLAYMAGMPAWKDHPRIKAAQKN